MDSLPVELVEFVFGHLNGGRTDIKNFRLVSKRYAAIGVKYLSWVAQCLLHKESHRRLTEMLQCDIRHVITAMQYDVFCLPLTYDRLDEWEEDIDLRPHPDDADFDPHCYDDDPPGPCPDCGEVHEDENLGSDDDGDEEEGKPCYMHRQCAKFWARRNRRPRHELTSRSLRAYWKKYREAKAVQQRFLDTEAAEEQLKLMTTVLSQLPQLQRFVINTERFHEHRWLHCSDVFRDHLTIPSRRRSLQDLVAVSPTNAFLKAFQAIRPIFLQHLTINMISWQLFEQDQNQLKAWFKNLHGLKSLVLGITDTNCEPGISGLSTNHARDCRLRIRSGIMADVLAELHQLVSLNIAFDFKTRDPGSYQPANLHCILGAHTWPLLKGFTVMSVEARPEHFLNFIKRHAKTLEGLWLSEIDLIENGSWPELFKSIKANTKLKNAGIHGNLLASPCIDGDEPEVESYIATCTQAWHVMHKHVAKRLGEEGAFPTCENMKKFLTGEREDCPLTRENAALFV